MLQEYILISIEVFRKISYNNISKLKAWLYFIGLETLEETNQQLDAQMREIERLKALLATR